MKQEIIQPFIFFDNTYVTPEILDIIKNNVDNCTHEYMDRIGKVGINNKGEVFIVLDYINFRNVLIMFLDEYHYTKWTAFDHVVNGSIKNKFTKNIFNGVVGDKYDTKNPLLRHIYKVWYGILQRTNKDYISVRQYLSSYINCSICDDWMLFSNFCDWYLEEYNQLNHDIEYHIDKDILQWNREYKIYGPDTCILIPAEINFIMETAGNYIKSEYGIGVTRDRHRYAAMICRKQQHMQIGRYDTAEEAHIAYINAKYKYVTDKVKYYYSIGALSDRAFDAILNLNFV